MIKSSRTHQFRPTVPNVCTERRKISARRLYRFAPHSTTYPSLNVFVVVHVLGAVVFERLDHFSRVARVNAVVARGRRKEDRRIFRALLDVVIGRVPARVWQPVTIYKLARYHARQPPLFAQPPPELSSKSSARGLASGWCDILLQKGPLLFLVGVAILGHP